MKKVLESIKPNLQNETNGLWDIIKYMIKSNLTYEKSFYESSPFYTSISKWLFNINPDFIKKYLSEPSIEGVFKRTKSGSRYFNHIKSDASFIMKISDNGFIIFTEVNKDTNEDETKLIKVIFFGKDAYINYRKYMIFHNKIMDKLYGSRIRYMYVDSVNKRDHSIHCEETYIESRGCDTVYTNNDVHRKICSMYTKWARNEKFYKKLGVNNKLGILLTGPVGSGKSTIGRLLASQPFKSVLLSPNMTCIKESLNILMSENTDNLIKIVLLEDIDTVLNKPIKDMNSEEAENARNLLQILDSNESPDNTVFIATTNYYDKLIKNVPNLVRPGRFDIVEEIGYLNKETADKMISNFNNSIYEFNNFKINPNDVYEAHSKKYPKLKYEYSPAAIQSIMIELMNEKVFDK